MTKPLSIPCTPFLNGTFLYLVRKRPWRTWLIDWSRGILVTVYPLEWRRLPTMKWHPAGEAGRTTVVAQFRKYFIHSEGRWAESCLPITVKDKIMFAYPQEMLSGLYLFWDKIIRWIGHDIVTEIKFPIEVSTKKVFLKKYLSEKI